MHSRYDVLVPNDWQGGSAAAGDAERRGSAEWKDRGFCLKDFRD
jgi:hypothetical protein